MIELVQPLQEHPLDQDAGDADDDRCEDERRPVSDAEEIEHQIGDDGAKHVLRAVRKIDDVEHAEDHGKPEAQQSIERAVDQPDDELTEQGHSRYAVDRGHGRTLL